MKNQWKKASEKGYRKIEEKSWKNEAPKHEKQWFCMGGSSPFEVLAYFQKVWKSRPKSSKNEAQNHEKTLKIDAKITSKKHIKTSLKNDEKITPKMESKIHQKRSQRGEIRCKKGTWYPGPSQDPPKTLKWSPGASKIKPPGSQNQEKIVSKIIEILRSSGTRAQRSGARPFVANAKKTWRKHRKISRNLRE